MLHCRNAGGGAHIIGRAPGPGLGAGADPGAKKTPDREARGGIHQREVEETTVPGPAQRRRPGSLSPAFRKKIHTERKSKVICCIATACIAR